MVERMANEHQVFVLKITPHFHEPAPSLPVIAWDEGFVIYDETSPDSQKDSSRYLAAGAARVLFITARRDWVGKAVKEAIKHIPACVPLICESGELARFYRPAVHILVAGGEKQKIPQTEPDLVMGFDGVDFTPSEHCLQWDTDHWEIRS